MEVFFAKMGEKPFRAKQVIQWLHQYGVDHFDGMTNLSKALRSRLEEVAEICNFQCCFHKHGRAVIKF